MHSYGQALLGLIRDDVRFGGEEVLQHAARGGAFDSLLAEQGAQGGFGPVGDHAHGIEQPLAPRRRTGEAVFFGKVFPQ